MGENYVLGNEEDNGNEFTPYDIDMENFRGFKVASLGLGSQHIVVLLSRDKESSELPDFEQAVHNFALPEELKPGKKRFMAIDDVRKSIKKARLDDLRSEEIKHEEF